MKVQAFKVRFPKTCFQDLPEPFVFHPKETHYYRQLKLRARGSTGRSMAVPLGNQSYASVREANQMVARVCLLFLLAAARGIWVILEQPRGSLLAQNPAFEYVCAKVVVWRKHIRMQNFGAPTQKGTWLYSSRDPSHQLVLRTMYGVIILYLVKGVKWCSGRPEIDEIDEFQLPYLLDTKKVNLVDTYQDSSGRKRVKGNAQLKQSQSYPRAFLGLSGFVPKLGNQ